MTLEEALGLFIPSAEAAPKFPLRLPNKRAYVRTAAEAGDEVAAQELERQRALSNAIERERYDRIRADPYEAEKLRERQREKMRVARGSDLPPYADRQEAGPRPQPLDAPSTSERRNKVIAEGPPEYRMRYHRAVSQGLEPATGMTEEELAASRARSAGAGTQKPRLGDELSMKTERRYVKAAADAGDPVAQAEMERLNEAARQRQYESRNRLRKGAGTGGAIVAGSMAGESEATDYGREPFRRETKVADNTEEDGVLKRFLKNLGGNIEVLGTLGTGAAAYPLAGAAGLLGSIAMDKEAGGQIGRRLLEAGTYMPKSDAGRAQLEALAHAVETAKIPPYVPGVGQGARTVSATPKGAARVAATQAAEEAMPLVMKAAPAAEPLYAVKEPGGAFSPRVAQHISTRMFPDIMIGHEQSPHLRAWADKAIPRYVQRQLGTSRDPLNPTELRPGMTYENAVDRLLKASTNEEIANPADPRFRAAAQADVNPNARPGEPVWTLHEFGDRPGPRTEAGRAWNERLRHMGDVAAALPPEDLARMDMAALAQATARADRAAAKTRGRQHDARLEAAGRVTAAHPEGPMIQGPGASWYRYGRGMDPEQVALGLSVDTCLGGHCVAGVAHNRPELGFSNTWVPARDITTGQPYSPNLSRSTNYIDRAVRGQGDILSLRTPEGLPVATAEMDRLMRQGVPRSFVRDLIGKPEYLRWQREQRLQGVPLEQQVEVPGGGFNVPSRGTLDAQQIASIVQRFPHHQEALAQYLANPPQAIKQYKGFQNLAVSPKFTEEGKLLMGHDLLKGGPGATSAGVHDLERSGIIGPKGFGKAGVVNPEIRTIQSIVTEMEGRPPNPNPDKAAATAQLLRDIKGRIQNAPAQLPREESAMLEHLTNALIQRFRDQ